MGWRWINCWRTPIEVGRLVQCHHQGGVWTVEGGSGGSTALLGVVNIGNIFGVDP